MTKRQRVESPLDDIGLPRASRARPTGDSPPTADRRRSTSSKASKAAPRSRTRTAAETPAPKTQSTTLSKRSTSPDDWYANHERVTFYCPTALLAALQATMTRSGLSKTRVIVDALQAHLKAR
jgi:hypothetical protein